MSYKDKSAFWAATDGKFSAGADMWEGQELDDTFADIKDSVQWKYPVLTLSDAATVVWNYALGEEAKATCAGNRTLSITNLPSDHVSYGCLEFYQDSVGGRTLTLPSPKTTNGGSINPAPFSKTIITFRYDGTKYEFNISQHS